MSSFGHTFASIIFLFLVRKPLFNNKMLIQLPELDVRTAVDSREYAEVRTIHSRCCAQGFNSIMVQLPAFLLLTLVYAFWLSFSGFQLAVAPTAWPLAWLGLAIVIFVNPLPVFYPYSRYWLLQKSGGLLLSGTRRVEVELFGYYS
jgi:xenotropic and polytropic retrovirus receptor 1